MGGMPTRLEQYQQLPKAVSDFFFDLSKQEAATAKLVTHGITEDMAFDLLLIAEDVLLKNVRLQDVYSKVADLTKLDPEKAKIVARDLIGSRLLPLEAFTPGVPEELARLGGTVAEYPAERVEKRKVSAESFVRETLNGLNLRLPDPALQSRLEFILVSFARGVRTADQAVAMMGRSDKVGGLNLSEEQARKVITVIDERKKSVDVEEMSTEDRKEERGERKEEEKTEVRVAPAVVPNGIDTFVADVLAKINLSFPSSDLNTRLKNVVTARLRDLRTLAQTKDLLVSPIDKNGLALSPEQAAQVATIIESAVAERSGAHQAVANQAKSTYIDDRQKQLSQREVLAQREGEVLAKRYAAMTGKAPIGAVESAAPASARVSAAVPKMADLSAHERRVDAAAKAVMTSAAPRPAPVMPKLSTPSVAPAGGADRPPVADVKYAPKLAGPVQELQMMTPVDFRRLSSDPEQAALKVQDIIGLLTQQSYEKRVEGVQAWQSSPVNKLYIAMSQDVLTTGKSVVDVSAAWKAAGKEALTPEELRAIVKLNAGLHF